MELRQVSHNDVTMSAPSEELLNRISVYTDQGIKNNTQDEAVRVAGENSDFGISDLFEAIEAGNYPSWTIYFQVMDPKTAEKFKCRLLLG